MYPATGAGVGAVPCSQETWERASQRLIRSGEWRVPTQAELNAASKALIGQRICIKGYGVGTVRQFIKSSGWGAHSSHAVDLGIAGGVVSIKLLRKRNGETPWLKSTGRGAQSQGVGSSLSVGSHAGNVDAQIRMAQLFMQRGNDASALDVVLKALEISPTDPHLLRLKTTLQPPAAAVPSYVDRSVPAYAPGRPAAAEAPVPASAPQSAAPSYFHISPAGHREPFSPSDNQMIFAAQNNRSPAVRVSPVRLANGHVLNFEVRFGANACSSRQPQVSPTGICQVNLGNDNTVRISLARSLALGSASTSGRSAFANAFMNGSIDKFNARACAENCRTCGGSCICGGDSFSSADSCSLGSCAAAVPANAVPANASTTTNAGSCAAVVPANAIPANAGTATSAGTDTDADAGAFPASSSKLLCATRWSARLQCTNANVRSARTRGATIRCSAAATSPGGSATTRHADRCSAADKCGQTGRRGCD